MQTKRQQITALAKKIGLCTSCLLRDAHPGYTSCLSCNKSTRKYAHLRYIKIKAGLLPGCCSKCRMKMCKEDITAGRKTCAKHKADNQTAHSKQYAKEYSKKYYLLHKKNNLLKSQPSVTLDAYR